MMKVYLSRYLSTDRAVLAALDGLAPEQKCEYLRAHEASDWDTVYRLLAPYWRTHCALNKTTIHWDLAEAIRCGWAARPLKGAN
jgi:hypothetical protein